MLVCSRLQRRARAEAPARVLRYARWSSNDSNSNGNGGNSGHQGPGTVGWFAKTRREKEQESAQAKIGQSIASSSAIIRKYASPPLWTKDTSIEDGTDFGLRMGVLHTTRPQATTLYDLLENVEIMRMEIKHPNKNPSLLALLFTPSFAKYALDPNVPPEVLERVTSHRRFRKKDLDVYTAVVDKLPTLNDDPLGAEGMAYMYLPSPGPTAAKDTKPLQKSAQKPGSLTFEVPKNKSAAMFQHLQLPLAQTIFTTGRVSTLIHRRYNKGTLGLESEQQLESQTLRLPFPSEERTAYYRSPLVPLTPFRTIKYVMGNIVRQVSTLPAYTPQGRQKVTATPSTPEDPTMPASQELETAVTDYFTRLGKATATVSVWALVFPPNRIAIQAYGPWRPRALLVADYDFVREQWSEDGSDYWWRRQTDKVMQHALMSGGRLIKVISGGGGWGKKAGLLSLDPDTEYSTRELRQDEGWQFDFANFDDGTNAAAEAQKKQALGEIVKEGDNVMFLLAEDKQIRSVKRAAEAGGKRALEAMLGAIPSTIDYVPDTQTADNPGIPSITHDADFFGMLSEGGMAALVSKGQTRHQTKIDVPLGRYYIGQDVAKSAPSDTTTQQSSKPSERVSHDVRGLGPWDTITFKPSEKAAHFDDVRAKIEALRALREQKEAAGQTADDYFETNSTVAVHAKLRRKWGLRDVSPDELREPRERLTFWTSIAFRAGGEVKRVYEQEWFRFVSKAGNLEWSRGPPAKRRHVWKRMCHRFTNGLHQNLAALFRMYKKKAAAAQEELATQLVTDGNAERPGTLHATSRTLRAGKSKVPIRVTPAPLVVRIAGSETPMTKAERARIEYDIEREARERREQRDSARISRYMALMKRQRLNQQAQGKGHDLWDSAEESWGGLQSDYRAPPWQGEELPVGYDEELAQEVHAFLNKRDVVQSEDHGPAWQREESGYDEDPAQVVEAFVGRRGGLFNED